MVSDLNLFTLDDGKSRCFWCIGHQDYMEYHDAEWGQPVCDDLRLFEKICLEGFQSGLSWLTILRKRESFRRAFCDFDYHTIARFTDSHVTQLLRDSSIIRHRGKIEATINNALRAQEMEKEHGTLAAWFWKFEPRDLAPLETRDDARNRTTCPEAIEMSKSLKKLGWKFVGPTTSYAFMQAMGMVNDHLIGCDSHRQVEDARQRFGRPGDS